MLTQVNPLHLSKIWYTIKPGIEEILEDLNKDCLQELWTPEDVYTSIKVGESVLLLGDEGFVVFQVRQDKYTGTKQFFVWLGYSFNPAINVLEESHRQLLDIARYYQCEMMVFTSNRRGWGRRAKDIGFVSGLTTYTMRI
jgi:hypothetical protein